MTTISATAIFCEDIREEAGGSFTLIGVLPDVINIAPPPGPQEQMAAAQSQRPPRRMLSKLCIFTRVSFDPAREFSSVNVRLTMPNGMSRELGEVPRATIEEARQFAKSEGHSTASVLVRHAFNDFKVGRPGEMKVEVLIDGAFMTAGALHFRQAPARPELVASPSVH